ncbi:hypothetical protein P879_00162 [Paragonimus westermani]|uniref:procollagen-proline 4-dioxygenase n=1 Tax=Paragonimus westermani TaxID=34504 RepID=A0A8T0DT59_9TREM|nr:hypothetical protein P879_00162 [Paragonimus westermani]
MLYVRLSIFGISLFVPSPNWFSRSAVRNQTATMHNFCRIPNLLPASLFSLILLCLQSTAEYYTAISELNKALQVGQQLAADLETYLELEEVRLDRIRRVARRLETDGLVPKLAQDPEDFFGNPVNAYLTVRRLALNWKTDLLSLLDSHAEQNTDEQKEEGSLSVDKEQLAKVRARVEEHTSMLPGDNDLTGAAEALLRLQTTYKLSAVDIANGKLINNLTCPRLTASQCLNLGQQAYELGEFARAEEWFRVAYNRLWEELAKAEEQKKMGYTEHSSKKQADEPEQEFDFAIPDEVQPTTTEILDHLAYSLGRQGRYAEALNVTRLILEQDPTHKRSRDNEEFYRDRIQRGEGIIGPVPPPEALSKFEQETETYQALCRGEILFPMPPSNTIYCQYSVPHPYYKIGPVKEEILYPNPKIVMWYEVIHPSEIERIQKLASPRLRRATVKNPVTGKLENAYYRTSKSAWLPDNLDEVTHRMNQRIHALTGLSMETSEDLQVGNYGIGGYYAPHFDFGRKREKDAFEVENGNRIATIIFYMSDVKAGGSTVFNRVGAAVSPTRGAAGFWYNLYPSGEGDLRTRHVACPVLVGSKWVMNVWFHERGQEFYRRCGLEQDPVEMDDGF